MKHTKLITVRPQIAQTGATSKKDFTARALGTIIEFIYNLQTKI